MPKSYFCQWLNTLYTSLFYCPDEAEIVGPISAYALRFLRKRMQIFPMEFHLEYFMDAFLPNSSNSLKLLNVGRINKEV